MLNEKKYYLETTIASTSWSISSACFCVTFIIIQRHSNETEVFGPGKGYFPC